MKTTSQLKKRNIGAMPVLLLAFNFFLSSSLPAQTTNNLWAYWNFNDGTATDNSGNGRNGTLTSGVTATNGWSGKGMYFDNTGGYIDCGTDEFLSNATVSAFVKMPADFLTNQDLNFGNIVYRWTGNENLALSVYRDDNGILRFWAGFHPGQNGMGEYQELHIPSQTIPVADQFYQIALTYGTDNILRLYVNGILENQAAANTNFYGTCCSQADLKLGLNFKGILDEVRIYNTALSSNDVKALFDIGILQSPTNQAVSPGSNVTFNVSVNGQIPLFYQWFFNETNILVGETNASLALTNVTLGQMGNYSVIISNSISSVRTTNAYLTVLDMATPLGDGIPNWWKFKYDLSFTDSTLATNHPLADSQLTYLQKYLYGLNPLTNDTDDDGVSDYNEIFDYHSNPLSTDSAGDGIPDGWKVQYGLNPSMVYSNREAGFDGVTYWQVYQYDQTHTNQLNPNAPFAVGSDLSNYELINSGQHTNKFYYDHEDRLLGMEPSRGISIGYQYDGNGNLTHQAVLSRAGETNGLPVLWQWLNGITNQPGVAYTDSDGDGWTAYQEWLADTDPNDSNSTPNLLGNPGTNIASLTLPFTPTNFVVGVGNLDGLPGDEIVIGADGNPGTNSNSLFVLTQTATNWSTQQINIGSFGITSIAIGQPASSSATNIYIGLRQSGGRGKILELNNTNGNWQQNTVVISTNEAAFVLGVRSNKDLLVSYATNGLDGALFSLSPNTNGVWSAQIIDTNVSHRGLGIIGNIGGGSLAAIFGQNQSAIRLLDNGGIQVDSVLSEFMEEPVSTNRYLWRGTSLALGTPRFQTNVNSLIYAYIDDDDNSGQISAGDNFVLSEYTNLVHFDTNGFFDNFPGTSLNRTFWTNIVGNVTVNGNKVILTGANTSTGMDTSRYFKMTPGQTVVFSGANIPSTALSYPGFGVAASPRGPSFNAIWSQHDSVIYVYDGDGSIHSTGVNASGPTTLHEFEIVWNSNGKADYYIDGNKVYTGTVAFSATSGYLSLGVYDAGEVMWCSSVYTGSTTNFISSQLVTLSRSSIAAENLAQSYGVASVNWLNSGRDVVFTGEPDGRVFAWTATNSSAPLQRQLFTSDYTGKAWHALSAVNMAAGGQGLIGLMVDPTNQSTCNVIFWPPESTLSSPQSGIVETAPSAAVLPSANPLGSNAVVTVRLWDNEGDTATPFLQYQFLGTTDWHNATLIALDDSPYNPAVRVTALPDGANHTVTWNALSDVDADIVTNVLLRARAQDFMLSGDWSQPTPFQLNTTMDVNPPPATNSVVQFTGITPIQGGIQFDWQGNTSNWLYLQRSPALAGTNAIWVNVWTGVPPTSIFGSYTDYFGTNTMEFYRLKVVSP